MSNRLIQQNEQGEWVTRDSGRRVADVIHNALTDIMNGVDEPGWYNELKAIRAWVNKSLSPPDGVTWDGNRFWYTPKTVAFYKESYPHVTEEAIEHEIERCGIWHHENGSRIKGPMARLSTWMRNAFGERIQKPKQKTDEPLLKGMSAAEAKEILGW
jgi:hypothetical protein